MYLRWQKRDNVFISFVISDRVARMWSPDFDLRQPQSGSLASDDFLNICVLHSNQQRVTDASL
jgi:hypothetical protein